MEKETNSTKVINTYKEFFGKKHYVVLVPDKDFSDTYITETLIKVLKCDPEYASDRLGEIYNEGETCVYSGNIERCELIQLLLSRENEGFVTEVSKD
jgi:hypothetical protein